MRIPDERMSLAAWYQAGAAALLEGGSVRFNSLYLEKYLYGEGRSRPKLRGRMDESARRSWTHFVVRVHRVSQRVSFYQQPWHISVGET